ncbi:hypothetical protein [Agromyces sp. C10]|uniref:hypothetical protein n=1 Tax=Agromyces sp. C10 TaxID=2935077 RepID=UPI00200ADA03|nr:hypothetical protein [Agromyces sp. C10]MCK8609144.1 hypothetical protein [Agromyces sp. C10]
MTLPAGVAEAVERHPELPPFRLLLPPGWTRHLPTDDEERELLARMRERIRPLGRPDLEFQLTAGTKAAFRELRAKDGIAMYLPTQVGESTAVPMSMSACRITGPDGRPLDGQVAELFRRHGAEFLGDDRTIVRWRRTFATLPGLERVGTEQVNHLVPVPGTGRRVGVLLSTAIVRDPGDPVEGIDLDALVALADAIASTFAWAPSRGAAGD